MLENFHYTTTFKICAKDKDDANFLRLLLTCWPLKFSSRSSLNLNTWKYIWLKLQICLVKFDAKECLVYYAFLKLSKGNWKYICMFIAQIMGFVSPKIVCPIIPLERYKNIKLWCPLIELKINYLTYWLEREQVPLIVPGWGAASTLACTKAVWPCPFWPGLFLDIKSLS